MIREFVILGEVFNLNTNDLRMIRSFLRHMEKNNGTTKEMEKRREWKNKYL